MCWQQHIEGAGSKETVDYVEVANWVATGGRASVDTFRPMAETTDTSRVWIDDLNVVAWRP
jgi:hypothetical protein